MAISLDAATKRMARAIDAGKLYDAFPWSLRLPLVLLRIAPAPLGFVALTALVALFRDPASSWW